MAIEFKAFDYLWAVGMAWVGYIHTQLKDKPSRIESELQQQINDERHREIKDDLQRLEDKIDELADLVCATLFDNPRKS